MKCYLCDEEKVKWFKKVDWLRVIVLLVVLFLFFFSVFYFVIGGVNVFIRAFSTSLFLSCLISSGLVVSYCVDNRVNLYVVDGDKLYVIYPHSYGIEYDCGIISYGDFKKFVSDKKNVVDIIKNIKDYKGIDLVKVEKVKWIRKWFKNFKFRAEVSANEWYGCGGIFSINDYVLKRKKKKRTFVVPFDYFKYEELYEVLESKVK